LRKIGSGLTEKIGKICQNFMKVRLTDSKLKLFCRFWSFSKVDCEKTAEAIRLKFGGVVGLAKA
jgi:hypothetical protein